MEFIMGLGDIKNIENVIKIFFISIFTLHMNFKLVNKKLNINIKNTYIVTIGTFVSTVICGCIEDILSISYRLICMALLLSIIFKKISEYRFAYSLLITVIALTINYIIFSLSAVVTIIPIILFDIQSTQISLVFILLFYVMILSIFYKIKRFKNGFIFLQKNIKNEYIDILILDVSIIILFCITILSNYNKLMSRTLGTGFIIFSIFMFVSIQKSLQLYYKQKLQERETEEIKEELKNKDKEIMELEKENLKLNKKNHSIAHKQKLLEYEIEQIMLDNETIEKSDIKAKIEELSKEMREEIVCTKLTKTNVDKIDNMLAYMQSECVKHKIDFQLQVNGNIHHMVNKHIDEEDLEILLADLIKNAIIAINHSENVNKSILVRLGLIDGFYSLYVYDSGIEFEIETLMNLGIKPSTTHANEGGTGMGLMNTFDTLNKYKASLVIDEYGKPVKDNFTKVIKIIFDSKHEYKITSYREKEIKEKDINKRVSF